MHNYRREQTPWCNSCNS